MPSHETTDLSLYYKHHGDEGAPAVVLLHGWPDDPSTWDGVFPPLVSAGYRVIVPTLRGFGATRFLDASAPRTGNSGMLAVDVLELLDRLGVQRFSVVGHDWGSNIAEALAVGWPGRVEKIALLSTPPRLGGLATPTFRQAQRYWYHWFMATPRGEEAVRNDPHGFAHLMWENWAPRGWFDEKTFQSVARSFDNPDWIDVTLHSYRSRWGSANPDARSAWLDEKVKMTKTLALPTIYIQGLEDGVTSPDAPSDVQKKFQGPFEAIVLPDVGHFLPREAPEKIAALVKDFLAGR